LKTQLPKTLILMALFTCFLNEAFATEKAPLDSKKAENPQARTCGAAIGPLFGQVELLSDTYSIQLAQDLYSKKKTSGWGELFISKEVSHSSGKLTPTDEERFLTVYNAKLESYRKAITDAGPKLGPTEKIRLAAKLISKDFTKFYSRNKTQMTDFLKDVPGGDTFAATQLTVSFIKDLGLVPQEPEQLALQSVDGALLPVLYNPETRMEENLLDGSKSEILTPPTSSFKKGQLSVRDSSLYTPEIYLRTFLTRATGESYCMPDSAIDFSTGQPKRNVTLPLDSGKTGTGELKAAPAH
jgi:hypothetical protein